LTVYFWERAGQRWNTWSDARPIGTPGFDPAARFTAPGPWTGCSSPARAAGSRFRLASAWRNSAGRLSGRETTQMIDGALADAADGPAETRSWTDLAAMAWELFGTGLTEPDELAPLLLLRPRAWGESWYDDVHQELTVTVLDEEDRLLPLALAHTDHNRLAIQRLEQAVRERPPAILGTLHLRRGMLAVEPISLIDGPRVISLGLEEADQEAVATADRAEDTAGEIAESDDDGSESPLTDPTAGPVGALLASAAAEIDRLAESGSAAYRGWPRLRLLGERGESLGLSTVATSLRRLVDSAGTVDDSRHYRTAGACLRAAYVVRVTAAHAAVAAAAAAYQ
jgi:hypothetical protein